MVHTNERGESKEKEKEKKTDPKKQSIKCGMSICVIYWI